MSRVLGLDIGGTHCRARLSMAGEVVDEAEAESASLTAIGTERAGQALSEVSSLGSRTRLKTLTKRTSPWLRWSAAARVVFGRQHQVRERAELGELDPDGLARPQPARRVLRTANA